MILSRAPSPQSILQNILYCCRYCCLRFSSCVMWATENLPFATMAVDRERVRGSAYPALNHHSRRRRRQRKQSFTSIQLLVSIYFWTKISSLAPTLSAYEYINGDDEYRDASFVLLRRRRRRHLEPIESQWARR